MLTSNISDQRTLFLLLGGVGAADLLHDFWAQLGDLLSLRRANDCIVCPKRRTAPFLTGEIKLAKDVTRAKGRTRLLLGSLKSRLQRLTTSSSFSRRFLFRVKSHCGPGVRNVKELPRLSGHRLQDAAPPGVLSAGGERLALVPALTLPLLRRGGFWPTGSASMVKSQAEEREEGDRTTPHRFRSAENGGGENSGGGEPAV